MHMHIQIYLYSSLENTHVFRSAALTTPKSLIGYALGQS